MGYDIVPPWDEMMSRLPGRFLAVAMAFGLLSACGDPEFHTSNTRHWVPLTQELLSAMQEKGMTKEDPVLIRTYKQEAEFEVWKKDSSGRYALLKTFPMCRWSGQLGPKRKEGDRQAPEGYYAITPAQMNPNSNYHLSYDIGYPNAYDRAHGGTGSYLMVHGDCSSAGCYSMTDKQIEEIYALVREAQSAGQKAVQMEAFPFRFTAANLARHRLDPNMAFWRNLKEGADRFEVAKVEPKVSVCNGRYVYDRVGKAGEAAGCGSEGDPELAAKVAEKERDDSTAVAELVSKGTPAVKLAYEDGGQHPSFRNKITETSRPDAIAQGPLVELFDAKGRLTNRSIQATGFDETSIAAAVTTVGSPDTSPTAMASATPTGQARPTSSSVASAGASPSARLGATSAMASAPTQAQPNATVVARRDANPSSTDVHLAFASPAAASAAAPANQDQPIYQKLFAKLPRLPFGGADETPPAPQPAAANVDEATDPAAPAPPSRPTRLGKNASKDSSPRASSAQPSSDKEAGMRAASLQPNAAQASPLREKASRNAGARPAEQASLDKEAGRRAVTPHAKLGKNAGSRTPSRAELSENADRPSPQAGATPNVDLFSSRSISAASSFSKGSVNAPAGVSGSAPQEQ